MDLMQIRMWVFTQSSFSLCCFLTVWWHTGNWLLHVISAGFLPLSGSLWALPAQKKPGYDRGSSLGSFFMTETLIIFHLFFPYIIGPHTITRQNTVIEMQLTYWGHLKLLKCTMLDAHIINPISCWWKKRQDSSRWWVLVLPSVKF